MTQVASDTIAAIATAPGEGAIAVVRISGPLSLTIADRIFHSSRPPPSHCPANTFVHGFVHADTAGIQDKPRTNDIDEVILLLFRAPHSYTGEDVVEIQGHGGGCSARRILRVVLDAGARLAEPGEFTKRAFLNGRIDLLQAEAVLDLIRSRSDRAASAAMEQLEGSLTISLSVIYNTLISTASDLESLLDFSEEYISIDRIMLINNNLQKTKKDIDALIRTWDDSRLLRDGALVVISGYANVGKSTLLNQLLGFDRAIVADIPGTTRDTIEESVLIGGIQVRLVDTAGLRDTDCRIERDGISRAIAHTKRADLVLYLIDGSIPLSADDKNYLMNLDPTKTIIIINKSDLGIRVVASELGKFHDIITCSLITSDSLNSIRKLLSDRLHIKDSTPVQAVISERHRQILIRCDKEIDDAIHVLDGKELSAIALSTTHLRSALTALGEATGRVYYDELLDNIFSKFCIGK